MSYVDAHPEDFEGLGDGVMGACPECGQPARLRGPSSVKVPAAPTDAPDSYLSECCGWWARGGDADE